MNDEYLIISNSNFLLRVSAVQIAYVSSDGSYCVLKLVDGSEYTFSFNLSVFEKKIIRQLKYSAGNFARVGRNYIINSRYIFSINLTTSELVLYSVGFAGKYNLHVGKDALRQLKELIDKTTD